MVRNDFPSSGDQGRENRQTDGMEFEPGRNFSMPVYGPPRSRDDEDDYYDDFDDGYDESYDRKIRREYGRSTIMGSDDKNGHMKMPEFEKNRGAVRGPKSPQKKKRKKKKSKSNIFTGFFKKIFKKKTKKRKH